MPSSHSRRNQISSLIYEHALTLDTTADIADSHPSPRCRRRRSVVEVYQNIGPNYFRRAYRMTYYCFCRLHMKLKYGIRETARRLQKYRNRGLRGGNYVPPPIPNGPVTTSVRLACALRYIAGGSPYDIMSVYGVSHTIVLDSVWCVVDAVNQLPNFHIEYPRSRAEQMKIAKGFEETSDVGFPNCAGCIDGLLIWTHKPSEEDAKKAGVGRKKFLCGRKGKFGLNCQAISDVRGRILDISIVYGGASSDCLAFEGSGIYEDLEAGLLHDNLVLFGDNSYLNSHYMVTPFPNVSSGSKDDFNFFHSQLRIRVECAFGMMVFRWGVLRSAIPLNITISKTIALVHALAKLHNFCIDEQESDADFLGDYTIPDTMQNDEDHIMMQDEGYIPMNVSDTGKCIPFGLVDGGHHLDDVPRAARRHRSAVDYVIGGVNRPRESLLLRVVESQKT